MPRISSAIINRGSLRPLPSDNGDATSRGYKFSVTTKQADAEDTQPEIDTRRYAETLREMEAAFKARSATSGVLAGPLVLSSKNEGEVHLNIAADIEALGDVIEFGNAQLGPRIIFKDFRAEQFPYLADWTGHFAPAVAAVKTIRPATRIKGGRWTLFGPGGKVSRSGGTTSGKLAETTHPKRR